jgi:hypothetical protein
MHKKGQYNIGYYFSDIIDNSYVQSQVGEVPRYSFRIQASLLIWLKVVKQTRESLGFFVKLQDILRPQRGGTL